MQIDSNRIVVEPALPDPPDGSSNVPKLISGVRTWHASPGPLAGLVHMQEDKDRFIFDRGYSWMTELLPHLGYKHVYDHIDFKKMWKEPENWPQACSVIPEFLSPRQSVVRWMAFPFDEKTGGFALTHFAGMSGVEDSRNVIAATLPRSDPRAGIFGYDEVVRLEQITDGAAQTIMLVESTKVQGPWIAPGGATIRGARGNRSQDIFNDVGGLGTQGQGTYVIFADGSVRLIPETIDPGVFRALCTTHGAETVDLTSLPPVTDVPPTGGTSQASTQADGAAVAGS